MYKAVEECQIEECQIVDGGYTSNVCLSCETASEWRMARRSSWKNRYWSRSRPRCSQDKSLLPRRVEAPRPPPFFSGDQFNSTLPRTEDVHLGTPALLSTGRLGIAPVVIGGC